MCSLCWLILLRWVSMVGILDGCVGCIVIGGGCCLLCLIVV